MAEAGTNVLNIGPEHSPAYTGYAILGGLASHLTNPYAATAAAAIPAVYNRAALSALQNLSMNPVNKTAVAARLAPYGALEAFLQSQQQGAQ